MNDHCISYVYIIECSIVGGAYFSINNACWVLFGLEGWKSCAEEC